MSLGIFPGRDELVNAGAGDTSGAPSQSRGIVFPVCGTARDARTGMWFAGPWTFSSHSLCQLTLACRTPEPLSPSRSGSQHHGQNADLPALIPGQRNPRLSAGRQLTSFLTRQWRFRGDVCAE